METYFYEIKDINLFGETVCKMVDGKILFPRGAKIDLTMFFKKQPLCKTDHVIYIAIKELTKEVEINFVNGQNDRVSVHGTISYNKETDLYEFMDNNDK